MIAAIGQNRELGLNNQLLWDIPKDMKFFRETTKWHPVIMWRKTFESIGRLLPKRTNIIITRNTEYKVEWAIIVNSLEEAIKIWEKENEEIFIIGWAQIYNLWIKIADKLYLTLVEWKFKADTFFPKYSKFKMIKKTDQKNEQFNFYFTEWIK